MVSRSVCFTHPGKSRINNEDSFYSADIRGLWIVCDGMGGHDEGSFASNLVTDVFENTYLQGDFEQMLEVIINQFSKIQKILDKKVENKNSIIGTTVILLFIQENNASIIHAGDSRCYIQRDLEVSLITNDHAQYVKEESGEKRKLLTNALRAPGKLSLDVKKFKVRKNDRFLLCTDGFYENLSSFDISKEMNNKDINLALDNLNKKVLDSSADDNITSMIVEIY